MKHFISYLEEELSQIRSGCTSENRCGVGQQCRNNTCIEKFGIHSRFAGKSQTILTKIQRYKIFSNRLR